ncbi:hypothetical protein ASC95_14430 [Pelomonas sp. Root1217]|uniref:hypothetical protein n=1 Tax=Pelomonas sp. Root1217 TaxID=1736430 RepID=UPI0007098396|nr:hypothetical protein [Pelomonas sp. Root1217]KQV50557.1 hypothetical protein ASC95_14430 [Pelomonas sp. Root1217]
MPRVLPLAITLAALLSGPAAQAQSLAGDVKACRQLTDSARRLACYDALPLPAEQPAKAVAPAPVAPADPVTKFGQESVKLPDAPPELKQIESRIRGRFAGWGANTRIELENGQSWRVADGSSAIYDLDNPKAIVHRGMMGAFFLEIEGIGFQIKVTRVR